ncbi:hypothetical protein MJO28_010310 [Puccinia striiformis f. sp. tritici]|uniref:Secreted protein n=3 Tax=Puccinia striiformis TaxID=27350 RepID=A0A2S4WHV5_9BASI|nr:hypothetical protein Pst134EA_019112 [Puccinia striiformis f. sp. tritici]KAI9613785.1 hypothetical protein H4Q26_009632 [Puccinia striiformis f. sp. tritici PST-130]POW21331.1 hypothetical protein PSHT_02566 [Puccinia striiformis]KAH9449202.1 hypothetical protein Pst134EB_020034 [Puccinia striiformis f. sp. tritici]KAH9458960.1 hypothetical protein Pst134EA_019112 [Puccinia striiformis f. sp. tritici]KAI7944615.1 hypothetical protein MJO28_010310 [Puccinia striiformis f. sp. tritici]
MFAVKDSPRVMIYILVVGMIATLANAYKCADAFQTEEGGYFPTPGTATCNVDGNTNYRCDFASCTKHQTFVECTSEKNPSKKISVTGLSYTTYEDTFTVSINKFEYVECPISKNPGRFSTCPNEKCSLIQ